MKDGSEKLIETPDILTKENTTIDLKLQDFSSISAITIRNRNTGYHFEISKMKSFNPKENLGFTPQHPISTAQDAIIKYEGITIKRPSNEIDDVIPEVTLNIHEKTEKTATLSVKPDVESAKDALITFVGNYNQAVTQINILSQTKPEIVEEITYLSEEEKEHIRQKLSQNEIAWNVHIRLFIDIPKIKSSEYCSFKIQFFRFGANHYALSNRNCN